MAKVKGPLFSLGASGQIAKTLVYMTWKGIDDVREYVIPANPKTAGQQTQRGYFTAAVEDWHTDGFTAVDVAAWNLYALAQKVAASGFNMLVKLKIACAVAAESWVPLVDCLVTAVGAAGAQVNITGTVGSTVKLYWGTSKTSMFNEEAMVDTAGDYEVTLAGCSASTKIYFYIKDAGVGEQARTGIYSFTTTA
jgi:hypothetical protein